jgi:hypothetical protein
LIAKKKRKKGSLFEGEKPRKKRGYFGESNEAKREEEEKRRLNGDSEEHIAILRDTIHTEPSKLQFTAHLIDMFIKVLSNTPIQLTSQCLSRKIGIRHDLSAQKRQEQPILCRGELDHQRIYNHYSIFIIALNTMCSDGGTGNKCR